jgi:hypothetical protein
VALARELITEFWLFMVLLAILAWAIVGFVQQ